jgi:hypothetical protein
LRPYFILFKPIASENSRYSSMRTARNFVNSALPMQIPSSRLRFTKSFEVAEDGVPPVVFPLHLVLGNVDLE